MIGMAMDDSLNSQNMFLSVNILTSFFLLYKGTIYKEIKVSTCTANIGMHSSVAGYVIAYTQQFGVFLKKIYEARSLFLASTRSLPPLCGCS